MAKKKAGGKYTRCNGYSDKCLGWVHVDEAAVLDCPACTYRSVRCSQCGGLAAALRGLKLHWAWFRAVGKEAGGHAERLREWFQNAGDTIHEIEEHRGKVLPFQRGKRAA